jgi:hypothetical protein
LAGAALLAAAPLPGLGLAVSGLDLPFLAEVSRELVDTGWSSARDYSTGGLEKNQSNRKVAKSAKKGDPRHGDMVTR